MFLRTSSLIAALLVSASYAHALEGKALLDKFVAQAAENGRTISWENLTEQDSSSFALTGVSITQDNGERVDIKNVVVRGLREADGRISYDSVAFVDLKSDSEKGGKLSIKGIASADADVPFGIWEDGLTAEEKRQRIKFGNFTINGVSISNQGVDLSLDVIAMTNADLPLDFRYAPEQIENAVGEPAAPATFDQLAVTGLKGSNQGVKFGMASLSLANAHIPTSLNATMYDWMKIYSSASINGITASLGDTPVFGIGTIAGTITPPDEDGTIAGVSEISGLMVNLKAIPDPNTQAIAQQLGYEKIEGSLTGKSKYNPSTGDVSATDTILKLDNMLDLAFDYSFSGYTAEIAQKLAQAQIKADASKNPMEVYGSMMGELSSVKLKSLKIGLTDRSLTGKLLDFQAKQMGTTGDQLAAGAPMMIGLGMGGLGMPELTEKVTSAVGKFLKDKGTLTVEAAPSEPVSIVNLFVAGQSDPRQLPGMVNLQITAD